MFEFYMRCKTIKDVTYKTYKVYMLQLFSKRVNTQRKIFYYILTINSSLDNIVTLWQI